MTKEFNWTEIEESAMNNKQFLDYAPNGEHTVKVAEAKQNTNGNGWFDFTFEETDYKFPKLSFAFFKDDSFKYRCHYYKEVFKLLGATEDQARKAVEVCESKDSREAIHKAYAETFGKLAKKHPAIPIEVRDQYDRDGNLVCSAKGTAYSETVFAKKTGLQFPGNKPQAEKAEDPLEGAEEITEDDDLSMPF